jgi:hypothetical protein
LLRRWNGRLIKTGTKGEQGKHDQHGVLLIKDQHKARAFRNAGACGAALARGLYLRSSEETARGRNASGQY